MNVQYPPEFAENAPGPLTPQEERLLRRTTLLRRSMVFLAIASVLVCLTTVAITVLAIRDSQKGSAEVLKQTERTARLVASCVHPGRKCYEDAQRRTGDAISNINRVAILAAACAASVDVADQDARIQETTDCVLQRLAKARKG